MSEAIQVEVKRKTDQADHSRKNVMIEELEKTLQKIPTRGLNNMSRNHHWISQMNDYYFKSAYSSGFSEFIIEHISKIPRTHETLGVMGYFLPTLPNRLNKLCYPLNRPYLPPQYIVLIEEDQRPRAKELFSIIISQLNDLYFEVDGVTVMDDELKKAYKGMIHKFILWMIRRACLVGWDGLVEMEISVMSAPGDIKFVWQQNQKQEKDEIKPLRKMLTKQLRKGARARALRS